MKFADRAGVADQIVEALFVGYFVHGLDIGEMPILLDIGVEHGLDRHDLERYLLSDEDLESVTQDNARAHRLGVNGVPSFVFDGPMVISGAQEPQILARMLDAAASMPGSSARSGSRSPLSGIGGSESALWKKSELFQFG